MMSFLNLLVLVLIPIVKILAEENNNMTQTLIDDDDTTTIISPTEMVKGGRIIDEEKDENSIDSTDITKFGVGFHELDTWEAPYQIRKTFPYYLAGYDEDRRPIWVGEIGKWNFRIVTDAGVEAEKIFEKYMAQTAHRLVKNIKEQSTPENPVTDGILILDMDHFSIIHMVHVRTISLILRLLGQFRKIIDNYMYLALVVNTNAAAHTLVTATRPVLGRIMEKVEVFGTNRANWLPQVLKHCPRDQLPPWYGGSNRNYTPLKVYG